MYEFEPKDREHLSEVEEYCDGTAGDQLGDVTYDAVTVGEGAE